MHALEALCHGFKFKEIVESTDDLPALYNNGDNGKYGEIELKIIDGIYTCDVCGTVGDSVMVNEWIKNIWLHEKQVGEIHSSQPFSLCF